MKRTLFNKIVAGVVVASQLLVVVPAPARQNVGVPAAQATVSPPSGHPGRGAFRPTLAPHPSVAAAESGGAASETIGADAISLLRILPEVLLPVGAASPEETETLARALEFYAADPGVGISLLEAFLTHHPSSAWAPSLRANLGAIHYGDGFFSKALSQWEAAWEAVRDSSDPAGRRVADYALGEYLRMNARLGRHDVLEPLLAEVQGRDVSGPATSLLQGAREGLWLMRNRPETAFRCGPMAVARIWETANPGASKPETLVLAESTPLGTSLLQNLLLAGANGLDMQMAHRAPGSGIVFPALVHWKVGHFAALVGEADGRLQVADPTFGQDLWISKAALDQEASGYCLVPAGALPEGWRAVDADEAAGVWGRGETHETEAPLDPNCDSVGGDSCPKGMPVYSFSPAMASLLIRDTPVGYSSPVGGVGFSALYDQRQVGHPATYTFSNLGAKWSHNWMSWVEFSESNPKTVTYFGVGGGQQVFTRPHTDTSTFDMGYKSSLRLRRVTDSRFELDHPNGSVSVFTQSEGFVPKRLFLTQIVDSTGSTVMLTYGSYSRLKFIDDALGMRTTFMYDQDSPVGSGDLAITTSRRIARVVDPFGRTARFEYDQAGRLSAITDIIGLRSSFAYGANDFIESMTTPYGTTRFSTGLLDKPNPADPSKRIQLNRWVEAENPLGDRERIEYSHLYPVLPEPVSAIPDHPDFRVGDVNYFMQYRNTFFWDKLAMREAAGDPARATIYHWLHVGSGDGAGKTAPVLESMKRPLENRVWFNYPGQAAASHGPLFTGTGSQPSAVARVLEDGTTQLTKMEYNAKGGIVKHIDPLGRETRFTYAANGIDLSEVRQVTGAGGATSRLARLEYDNAQHLPNRVIDAAGQTTHLQYNGKGQATLVTNAKGETIRFEYDMLGHPNFPNADFGFLRSVYDNRDNLVLHMDYDALGRVERVTNVEGSWVEYAYDDFDRTTTVHYMNGDTVAMEYDRLDLAKSTDRMGRSTQYFYNAARQLQAVHDPLGRITQLEYCKCGALSTLVDPNGNVTTWDYDVQGRVTSKRYADGRGEDYNYDPAAGRLKTVTDAKGQVTNFEYNKDGSIKRVFHTNAQVATPEVSFTYDPRFPRLSEMVDGIGTTAYTYNPINGQVGAGTLQKIDGPLPNDDIMFTYDELGRVTGTFIDGIGATRAFDDLGRVTSVVNPLGTFAFNYDGDLGRLLSMVSNMGHRTNYAYYGQADEHRLQTIENLAPGNAPLSKFDYQYDANGMITQWSQQAGTAAPAVWNYEYDAAYQLTGAVKSVAGDITKRFYYSYDVMGNRTSEQIDNTVTTGVFNSLNQLTEVLGGGKLRISGTVSEPARVYAGTEEIDVTAAGEFRGALAADDGTTITLTAEDFSGNVTTRTEQVTVENGQRKEFEYDTNGNTTRIVTWSADETSSHTMTFEWDAKDQMVAVEQSDGRHSRFYYDGYGRRVRIVERENGAVVADRKFVWLGFAIAEERGSNGSSVAKRFLGSGEQRITGVSTTNLYYTKDHLGSIREVADANGVVRARYEYDPYGRMTKVEGDLDCDFGFTGHFHHAVSGLHLAPFRAYDAETGRWMSRDLLRELESLAIYGYADQSPTTFVDPLGLAVEVFSWKTTALKPAGLVGGCVVGLGVAAGVTLVVLDNKTHAYYDSADAKSGEGISCWEISYNACRARGMAGNTNCRQAYFRACQSRRSAPGSGANGTGCPDSSLPSGWERLSPTDRAKLAKEMMDKAGKDRAEDPRLEGTQGIYTERMGSQKDQDPSAFGPGTTVDEGLKKIDEVLKEHGQPSIDDLIRRR
jgi:RHS repeat-associated protein